MLHGHGDDGYQFTQPVTADFSTNVWYGGEPAGLKEYLFHRWTSINRYPEVIAGSLAQQAADHHQLRAEQVLINSGTTESIYLIAQAFAGRKTTIVVPAFAEYEDACRMHNHQLLFLDWGQLADLPALTTDLVFICNPNNPTGALFAQVASWIARNPQTIFVVDEAFIEFTRCSPSLIPSLDHHANLIIMRSLTKTYAIPGLRLGYVVSSPTMIARLKTWKQPWTVNALALEAGRFIFEQYAHSHPPMKALLEDAAVFRNDLHHLEGLRVHDSQTHFFLVETQRGTAAELKQFLMTNFGFLIRDASNFRGLGAGHFRLATLLPEKNKVLINALAGWKN